MNLFYVRNFYYYFEVLNSVVCFTVKKYQTQNIAKIIPRLCEGAHSNPRSYGQARVH